MGDLLEFLVIEAAEADDEALPCSVMGDAFIFSIKDVIELFGAEA